MSKPYLCQVHNPDTFRPILQSLRIAAEDHRYNAERIDALTNEGSRTAAHIVYLNHIDRVRKAIYDLLRYQGALQNRVEAIREGNMEAALDSLLDGTDIQTEG